jgi:hypothetical protein
LPGPFDQFGYEMALSGQRRDSTATVGGLNGAGNVRSGSIYCLVGEFAQNPLRHN